MGNASRGKRSGDYFAEMARRQRSFAVPSLNEQRAKPRFNQLDETRRRGLGYDRGNTDSGFSFTPPPPTISEPPAREPEPVNDTFTGIVDDLSDKPVNDTFTGIKNDVDDSPFASDSRYGDYGIVERDGAFDFYNPTENTYRSRFGSLEDAEAALQKERDKKARGERSYLDPSGPGSSAPAAEKAQATVASYVNLVKDDAAKSKPVTPVVEAAKKAPPKQAPRDTLRARLSAMGRREKGKPGMSFANLLKERKAARAGTSPSRSDGRGMQYGNRGLGAARVRSGRSDGRGFRGGRGRSFSAGRRGGRSGRGFRGGFGRGGRGRGGR